jgi:hypothetical protein
VTQVFCKTTIDIPAQAIWQAIGDFGAAGLYLSGVVGCTVEGVGGAGARRTLTSADGSSVVERLESLDGAARRLSYALLTDTPFRDCLTTMAVHDLGPSRAELEWSATFEPDGLPESEAAELMEAALAANCLALKQLFERDADFPAGHH